MTHEHEQPQENHTHTAEQLELEEIANWIRYGIKQGWCGPAICHEHDGTPPSNTEQHGCPIYIRIYKTIDEMDYVETNHPNSVLYKQRFTT